MLRLLCIISAHQGEGIIPNEKSISSTVYYPGNSKSYTDKSMIVLRFFKIYQKKYALMK